MGEHVTLTAKDGFKLDAYVAKPSGTPKGAIVVIQEIFGVNHHIRSVTDRFAGLGYVAVAPAMFDRAEKGVELGYDGPGIEGGKALRAKITLDQHLADTQAAIDYAKQFGKVGIVGFCFGGSMAFVAATRLDGLSAASGYYGGFVAAHANEKPKVPTILHFGELDHGIPMTDVEKVKQARPDVPVYVYKADHGFSCDERGSYNEAAHKQAWERTTELFKKYVG